MNLEKRTKVAYFEVKVARMLNIIAIVLTAGLSFLRSELPSQLMSLVVVVLTLIWMIARFTFGKRPRLVFHSKVWAGRKMFLISAILIFIGLSRFLFPENYLIAKAFITLGLSAIFIVLSFIPDELDQWEKDGFKKTEFEEKVKKNFLITGNLIIIILVMAFFAFSPFATWFTVLKSLGLLGVLLYFINPRAWNVKYRTV